MVDNRLRRPTKRYLAIAIVCLAAGQRLPAQEAATPTAPPASAEKTSAADKSGAWRPLLNGQDLTGWRVTKFGGEGEVSMENGVLVLGMGSPLTGITLEDDKSLPTCGYAVRLEARRVEGTDFFCGLTFPYQKSHASLILGGWGGGVIGISSLDGYDASENDTTTYMKFEKGRWYNIRLRVTEDRLDAWIDDRPIVQCRLSRRDVGTRPEVDLSKPLGLASYDTRAEIRNLELRRLGAEETKE